MPDDSTVKPATKAEREEYHRLVMDLLPEGNRGMFGSIDARPALMESLVRELCDTLDTTTDYHRSCPCCECETNEALTARARTELES